VKEEILRVGILAGDGASVVIDRFHPGEGRTHWIKSLHRSIWKPQKAVPYEIRIEEETCHIKTIIDLRKVESVLRGGLSNISHIERLSDELMAPNLDQGTEFFLQSGDQETQAPFRTLSRCARFPGQVLGQFHCRGKGSPATTSCRAKSDLACLWAMAGWRGQCYLSQSSLGQYSQSALGLNLLPFERAFAKIAI